MDEVRKYNPDIDKWIEEHPWCVTKIEDFDGDIEIKHMEVKRPKYDSEYNVIIGEYENDTEVSVIGVGNINFFTSQTGL